MSSESLFDVLGGELRQAFFGSLNPFFAGLTAFLPDAAMAAGLDALLAARKAAQRAFAAAASFARPSALIPLFFFVLAGLAAFAGFASAAAGVAPLTA